VIGAAFCGWSGKAFADSIISGRAVLARNRLAIFMILNSRLENRMNRNAKLPFMFHLGQPAALHIS
jgi:hypothetical protein